MTKAQLLANLDSRELTEWQAYFRHQLEVEQQRTGMGPNMRGT